MIGNRLCVVALATACAILCSSPSAIAAPYDGHWGVFAQTTRGHCESIPFGLEIRDGRIYSAGGSYGGYEARFGGHVSPWGRVWVYGVAGPRVARGIGQLGEFRGEGVWAGRGPSGRCSGVWSADRWWW